MNTNQIVKMIKEGIKFENQNTQFFISKQGNFYMCEFTKDCKYTQFPTIEKYARRILRFYKTGY